MKTITFKKNNIELDIKFSIEENTIWMSQTELSILYEKPLKNISTILSRMPKTTLIVHKMRTIGKDGKTRLLTHLNLDSIKQVGYKIDTDFTNEFVNWCYEQLNGGNNQLIPIGSNKIRFNNGNLELDVTISPQEDTVYLNKEQLALLFDTTRQNIEYHINNIYETCELEVTPTCKEILQVQIEGDRQVNRLIPFYNLDLIISLGFRINSKKGIEFRKWATKVLKEYMIRGYVINDKRTLVTDENYITLINTVNSIDRRVSILENEKNINLPKHKIITDGEILDAVTFVRGIIESANKSIVIIDPWVDIITMSILNYKKDDVLLYIITSSMNKISEKVLNRFPKLKDSYMCIIEDNHARYIVIDETIYYRFGPSINHIGDKFDMASKEEDLEIQEVLRKRISKYIDISLPIDQAIKKKS